MVSLNFPKYDISLKEEDGKVWIFDVIRKKYIIATPEEWVRQHFIHFLIKNLNYPKSLIRVEAGLTYNTLAKRADVIVFDRGGKPWLIVECKSHTEELSENTLRQVATYNKTLEAKFIVVTNGLKHFCFSIDHQQMKTKVLNDFPPFPA